MRIVLRAYPDCFDRRVRPDESDIGRGIVSAVALRKSLRSLHRDIGDGAQVHGCAGRKKLRMQGAVAATANNGDVHGLVR